MDLIILIVLFLIAVGSFALALYLITLGLTMKWYTQDHEPECPKPWYVRLALWTVRSKK